MTVRRKTYIVRRKMGRRIIVERMKRGEGGEEGEEKEDKRGGISGCRGR